ncbi:MAG: response regulator [Opitutae bacterium]|nr:response regulator [Opitutae bacterium]
MPAAPVLQITQDRRGFLWFGTRLGLVKYDGITCRVYRNDPHNPESLGDDWVNDMAEDAQGDMWIATERGLDRWNRKTERITRFLTTPEGEVEEWALRKVIPAADGTLWLGSFTRGLVRFDPRTGDIVYCQVDGKIGRKGLLSRLSALLQDRHGHLWLGSNSGGVGHFDPVTQKLRRWRLDAANPRSLPSDDVRAIAEDHAGNIWVGTEKGLCRLLPTQDGFEPVPHDSDDPGAAAVLALVVDRAGRVWAGGMSGGVRCFDPEARQMVRFLSTDIDPRTLATERVYALFEDRDGDIWAGHFPTGVSHLNTLHLNFHWQRRSPVAASTLSHPSICAFWEDQDGTLWVGTDGGGVNRLDPGSGQWKAFQFDPADATSLGSNVVLSLLRDHRGSLWVGTWNGGLNRLDEATGKFKRYRPQANNPRSLSSTSVWQMVEDRHQNLWIGTAAWGVCRYLPAVDGFERFPVIPKPIRNRNPNTVYSFLETRDHTFWAGTQGGLARFLPETNTWRFYRAQPGVAGALNCDAINDMIEDRAGNLWLGTNGGGLNHFNPRTEQFTAVRVADGLPSDIVVSLLEDAQERLWLATNTGLCRWDPRLREARVYDEGDGLPAGPFARGARLRRRNGEFLFGGSDGFIAFHPDQMVPDTRQSQVVLTELEVQNEPQRPGIHGSPLVHSITETQRLELPAGFTTLGLRFAALGYRAPERTRYEYQLEGFDTTWRQAGPERRASYTNLAPGEYRFRVRAANREGVWSDNGAGLTLLVLPAWWQWWWVRTLAVFVLLAGTLFIGWVVSNRRTRARVREAEHDRALAQERLRAAETLRQRDEQYALAIEATRGGVFDWDLLARSQNVSPRWREIHGLPPDSAPVPDATWRALLHPEDRAGVDQAIAGHLAGRSAQLQCEYRVHSQSGRFCWVFCQAKAQRDATGRPVRLVGAVTDITERRQAEMEKEKLQGQLIQAQKMESVGRLAGGVAHDFNNMLQAILGNAALVREAVPPGDPLGEHVEEIQKAAQRSADLTRQLLAFARKQTVSPQVVDLNAAVFGTLKLLQRLIGESIQLVWVPGRDLWAIKIDPSQIDQILANLTVNARDAIAGAGQISITTGNVVIDRDQTEANPDAVLGDFVQLVVSDTGHGMDRETHAHLFEPFYTTKGVGEGTGLGLATVYGIVKQNGGFINVNSAPGRGTEIKIYLPRCGDAPASASTATVAPSLRGTETVLLVEDEAQILQLGRRILERNGYTVLSARQPAEALQIVAQHTAPIHLLITDVVMPQMNGRELQERLVAMKPGLRCLFMSGYTADVIAHQGVLTEGINFIQKPFSNESLCRAVREILGTAPPSRLP